ncbi:MAG TPA: carbamoyl-phosphate synthase small subunit, partial [Erwiniaceae bacterium]|nr:carbamoyl-phosphate synthase small subunit [Erwiniaceae bacterium]
MTVYSLEDVLNKSAILVLEDGTQFHGRAIGATGSAVGEVVFNTSMTGYQEILTDPSYSRQIVTLTYPHIGNVGANAADEESSQVHAQGLVIRDLPLIASNYRSEEGLSAYLKRNNIVAIADIDTRKLTRLLREKGAQNGCIIAGDAPDAQLALQKAQAFPGLKGMDLAKEVCTRESYSWLQGSWTLESELPAAKEEAELPYHVVAYDYGVKRNILRMLVDRGCRLTVVPAQTPAEEVLKLNPDGIFLSNGPGDPEPCDYAIRAIQRFLETDIPVFGICLGHQLLALASG